MSEEKKKGQHLPEEVCMLGVVIREVKERPQEVDREFALPQPTSEQKYEKREREIGGAIDGHVVEEEGVQRMLHLVPGILFAIVDQRPQRQITRCLAWHRMQQETSFLVEGKQ